MLFIIFSLLLRTGASVAGKVRFYLANLKNESVYLHTPLPVVTSTTFFLNVTFSGTSPLGCGLAFNIIDIHEIMYHLDFRINYKDMLEKLVQSYQVDDVWQKEVVSREKLELRTGGNAVEVEVGRSFFKVWINGVKFQESIPIVPARLIGYSHLSLVQRGSCASFDLQSSFVEFTTGKCGCTFF